MPNPRFHPFVRLILCAIAVFVVVLGCSKVIQTIAQASGFIAASTPGANNPAAPPLVNTPARLILVLMAMQAPLMIGVVWVCRALLDSRSLASLGLRWRGLPQFFGGAFCGFLAIAFLFGLLWISGQVQVDGISERAQAVGASGVLLRLLFWALVMVGVGLSEEIVFRGYLLHNLGAWFGSDKTGLGAGAIIQGVLFALVHLGNVGATPTPEKIAAAWQAMPNIFLIGLFFALCAFKTGSLWFPIGFHAAWNFFLGSIFSLPVSGLTTFRLLETQVSGSHWLTGGSFGAEGSVLLTVITIVMIYLIRQAPDHPQFVGDIAALRPVAEPDYVEVPSRAPGLRERKEQRRTRTITTTGFEGWNDLAPPQRQRYTSYQPQGTAPAAGMPTAVKTDSPTEAFPESAFAADAPAPNVTVQTAPPAADEFANYPPPVAPPVSTDTATVVIESAPEVPVSTEKPPVSSAPIPNEPPASTTPVTPPALPSTQPPASPQTPPTTTPPVKKPPAPRW